MQASFFGDVARVAVDMGKDLLTEMGRASVCTFPVKRVAGQLAMRGDDSKQTGRDLISS